MLGLVDRPEEYEKPTVVTDRRLGGKKKGTTRATLQADTTTRHKLPIGSKFHTVPLLFVQDEIRSVYIRHFMSRRGTGRLAIGGGQHEGFSDAASILHNGDVLA
jgi:hypothetical protein